MLAAVPAVTFDQAAQALRRWKQPTLEQAVDFLAEALQVLRAAGILAELAPDVLAGYYQAGNWLVDADLQGQLMQDTLRAVTDVVPLDEEMLEVETQDGLYRLIPEPMGYPIFWDEWYETIQDLDCVTPEDGLFIFCRCLLMEEGESFELASEHFGWELDYPEVNNANTYIDCDRMFALLEERGLGVFVWAWKIAAYETGNLYFDYNRYEDNISLPDFNLAGVRTLQAQYQEALAIQAAYHEAQRLFMTRREVAEDLLVIYAECLEREFRPRTLAELFAAERENQETDPLGVLAGRLVDPVDGPTGPEGEGDDDDDGYPDECRTGDPAPRGAGDPLPGRAVFPGRALPVPLPPG